MIFNDIDGIYTYVYEAEQKVDCTVCSNIPQLITVEDPTKMKLKDLIELLCESPKVFYIFCHCGGETPNKQFIGNL